MNREEVLNIFLLANIPEIITQEEFNDVKKAIKQSQQENQELKKELEKYKLITIDYQDLEAKNQELKKQVDYLRRSIERKEETIIDLQNERVSYTNEYVCKLENQQKEFIDYLKSYLKLFDNEDIYEEGSYDTIEEILSKYKEIIGYVNE